MRLSYTYQYCKRGQEQIIELAATANSREEAAELNYMDFQANLFINGVFVGDISTLLLKAGGMEQMIDDLNWEEMYCDMVHEIAA